MKIFSASDLHKIDQSTIEQEGITSLDLMERAASAVVYEIVSRYPRNKHICIFAGPGNNGGDALAIARLLLVEGFNPQIYLFMTSAHLSADCQANHERLKTEFPSAQLDEIVKTFRPPHLTADTLVIDGLFGTGLNKPLAGGFTSLVEYINDSEAYVISIDIPSGLMSDWVQKNDTRHIIRAHVTYTFQYPKLAFFFSENEPFVGKWHVLDIGLKPDSTTDAMSRIFCVDSNDVASLIRPREKFSDKRTYGHGLLVSGRYGMMGATVLAAKAAMHSGIGLTTVHAPRCGNMIMQTSVPEALYEPDAEDLVCSDVTINARYNALGIGPGLGHGAKQTSCLLKLLSDGIKIPVVLDADALHILSRQPDLLDLLPAGAILTPHIGEFERLYECVIDNDSHRLQQAMAMASRHNIIIVLKGAHTAVVSPKGEVYINCSGNNGMATAGSGDVLTGIITSLLAQGYEPLKAAVLAVHLHGVAGDIAATENCEEYITAQDIIASLGKAFKKIRG
ncbi:MAG: NAD(P)H-hydrate dehydratase [Bacteroidaceae bacterium]|nr:NAD(P)H-hydrate dehydratase [Bacteroidaceae bacterium]